MTLVPFEDSQVYGWQEAVDNTERSPGAIGGPEFFSTTIAGWQRTHLFRLGTALIPFALSDARHLGVLRSRFYQGVQMNSILGISASKDDLAGVLESLPTECVIKLDLPGELYYDRQEQFSRFHFYPESTYTYHTISMPSSYEEWFMTPGIRRQSIRHALKIGVVVEFGRREYLEQFYEIYRLSFNRWRGQKQAHEAHTFDRIKRIFDLPGSRAEIAVAIYKDRVAAATIFCPYRRTAGNLYGGFDYEFRQTRAVSLLHSEVIRRLIQDGIKEYNLGLSLGIESLEHFKETLGATRRRAVTICRHRFPRLKRILAWPH